MRTLFIIAALLSGACAPRAPAAAPAPETEGTAPLPEALISDPPRLVRSNARCSEAAKQAKLSGSVTLEFIVGIDGRVERSTIRVLEASDPMFVDAARRTVSEAVYRPGRHRGRLVRVLLRQPVNFVCGAD